METRIFHGLIKPDDIAQTLLANFNRGPLHAQQIGSRSKVVVQIATSEQPISGGQTAIAINLEEVEDGVAVELGTQMWLGVAASLGKTALAAWRNPLTLLNRLDDLAQDIEYLQLSDQIWKVIEQSAHMAGATFELSNRLKRLICPYCTTPNIVGEASCAACGAPLGSVQPDSCTNCGYVIQPGERVCPNCGYHQQ